jgi:hypothetical protein
MGGAVMSLEAWEQRALDSIRDGLAGSDPRLATLLASFTRLASGEEMPVRGKLRARSLRATRRSCRKRRRPRRGTVRRLGRRLGAERAMLLLWLLITIALIATALALSGNGQSACPASRPVICAGPAPPHGSLQAVASPPE